MVAIYRRGHPPPPHRHHHHALLLHPFLYMLSPAFALSPPHLAAASACCMDVPHLDNFCPTMQMHFQRRRHLPGMLLRILVTFACLFAVFAAPLPASDPCKHCLAFHPFQKDNIAYCQAQNVCPIHDDAAVSDVLLKVDPPTVPFNNSLSGNIGELNLACYLVRRCF